MRVLRRGKGSVVDPLEIPWYHDFAPLGRPTPQAEGNFRANQQAKQDILFDYIRRAIEMSSVGGVPPRGAELFCADGFYSHFALQAGAAHMTGFDLGDPQSAGDPTHLLQARAIGDVLGHTGRAEFIRRDVVEVSGSYDFTICAGGLYHVSDPALLLRRTADYTRRALVVQTAYSLANSAPDYFEAPAPGWTWGSRFSIGYLWRMIEHAGYRIVDSTCNELTGNSRPEDRGSAYALCVRGDD